MSWLRFSLVFVWLATAVASVWELNGQSTALLVAAGLDDPALRRGLILGGAAVDAVLGLLLWLRPTRAVYLAALAAMLGMTVVATALLPALWLHPLGPLTKNLPIAAALWLLSSQRT
ncbi:DoxX-like family protein [Variovorax sp. LT1R16]|uniref:DoxX-like family protein n=1 Tax=Variovorax sp. LT1R16 TaxID=3443728 RepID=UPI003F472BE9